MEVQKSEIPLHLSGILFTKTMVVQYKLVKTESYTDWKFTKQFGLFCKYNSYYIQQHKKSQKKILN